MDNRAFFTNSGEENNAAFNLAVLNPAHIQRLTLDELKSQIKLTMPFYNLEGIEHELELWFNCGKESNKDPIDLVQAYKKMDFFPKIKQATDILLAMPCTTATVEISFSTLRRVKTWVRTTMKEDRLNGLCMLSAHRKLVKEKQIELEEQILDVFAANPRRLAL